MKVSVIIPVRNEELLIKKIIDQLENELKNLPHEIFWEQIRENESPQNTIFPGRFAKLNSMRKFLLAKI